MRWVLITPLGSLVEPEVNRNFAIVSGPTAAWAAAPVWPGTVASKASNGVTVRSSSVPSVSTTSMSVPTHAAMARP